jgi:hypothetical protein
MNPVKAMIVPVAFTIAASLFGSALLLPSVSVPVPPRSQRQCEDSGYEPAATTTRTVEIPEFGIEVDIPENYRTMKRQSGAIEILHPNDYQFISCIMAGGEGLGHGYYSEYIEVLDADEMAEKIQQLTENNWDRREFRQGDFSGYMFTATYPRNPVRNGAMFLGKLAGNDRLFSISPSCDCDTEESQVTRLLANIRLLGQR